MEKSIVGMDQGKSMKNPWTKKNPFMSMWLSGANAAMGKARGQATAAVRREANKAASIATTSGVKQVAEFWTSVLKPPSTSRKRRKSR
jgi:hypothetical protein